MTAIDIAPLRSGEAVFELEGQTFTFPSWESAVADVRRRGLTPHLLPFSPTPHVLATAPALRVLT